MMSEVELFDQLYRFYSGDTEAFNDDLNFQGPDGADVAADGGDFDVQGDLEDADDVQFGEA